MKRYLALNFTFPLLQVLALFNNNKLGYCSLNLSEKKLQPTGQGHLAMLGHQSDVRTLSFSSDNTALLSGSAESVKIWNRCVCCIIISVPYLFGYKTSISMLRMAKKITS